MKEAGAFQQSESFSRKKPPHDSNTAPNRTMAFPHKPTLKVLKEGATWSCWNVCLCFLPVLQINVLGRNHRVTKFNNESLMQTLIWPTYLLKLFWRFCMHRSSTASPEELFQGWKTFKLFFLFTRIAAATLLHGRGLKDWDQDWDSSHFPWTLTFAVLSSRLVLLLTSIWN